MKKLLFLSLLWAYCSCLWAVTEAYYQSLEGKSGYTLVVEVGNLAAQGYQGTMSYGDIWDFYKQHDIHPDGPLKGYIWDIYSDDIKFTPGSDQDSQSGSGTAGDYRYNREHTVPKSWFGDGTATGTAGSDVHHILPSEKIANSKRSNYPYGETSTGSACGNGKFGNCTFGDYTGNCFEPADQYKGDLARIYFYMVLRWGLHSGAEFDKSVSGTVVFNNTYDAAHHFGLTDYSLALLLKWHRQDPVSQKEIDRNNAIAAWANAGNRNPFVDYPYLAEYIWGELATKTVSLKGLLGSFDSKFVPGESDGSRVYDPCAGIEADNFYIDTTLCVSDMPCVLNGKSYDEGQHEWSVKNADGCVTANYYLTVSTSVCEIEDCYEVKTESTEKGYVSAEVSLSVEPNSGYNFVKWSDGNTDNPRQVSIDKAGHYSALFGESETIMFDPTVAHTIAEIKEAYSWGVVSNDDSIVVKGYIANMFLKPKNFATYGSVTFWLSDSEGGIDKSFELFNCYDEGGEKFSGFAPYFASTVTTNKDIDSLYSASGDVYVAGDYVEAKGTFLLYGSTYELNTNCYISRHVSSLTEPDTHSGCFSISLDKAAKGSLDAELILTATPLEGYHFVRWSDGNTDNPRYISWKKAADSYTAYFGEGEAPIVGVQEVIMIAEGEYYDLLGRKVGPDYHGIVITRQGKMIR